MSQQLRLRFGHGNEAVETCPGFRDRYVVWMLRFGHGNEAVETQPEAFWSFPSTMRFDSATAMKPWRQYYHSPQTVESCCFDSATAMKPWRLYLHAGGGIGKDGLRFGHGNEAVETLYSPFIWTIWTVKLRFGHGNEAVETPSILSGSSPDYYASIRPRQ